jgi:hypothetical protein
MAALAAAGADVCTPCVNDASRLDCGWLNNRSHAERRTTVAETPR